ncbi:MAG: MGMT family protein, partial [Nanoarchaeota archaeon]
MKPGNKLTFNQKCYFLLKKVPRGRITTYKAIAKKLDTRAYRAVGNAMNKNLDIIKIP